MLDKLSAELLLYIFSFLDLPDLDELSKLDPTLARLTADKALHNVRLRIVFPARVEHDLFALSRPTIPDLVHRGVLRGLAIERRWRAGSYLYSQSSVRQYEISQQLARQHAGHVVSQHLTRRSAAAAASGGTGSTNPLKQLYPGISHNLAHALLPVARKLKWSLRRDTLAKMVRDKSGITGVAKWLENNRLVQEGERVRLAICPPANFVDSEWSRATNRVCLGPPFMDASTTASARASRKATARQAALITAAGAPHPRRPFGQKLPPTFAAEQQDYVLPRSILQGDMSPLTSEDELDEEQDELEPMETDEVQPPPPPATTSAKSKAKATKSSKTKAKPQKAHPQSAAAAKPAPAEPEKPTQPSPPFPNGARIIMLAQVDAWTQTLQGLADAWEREKKPLPFGEEDGEREKGEKFIQTMDKVRTQIERRLVTKGRLVAKPKPKEKEKKKKQPAPEVQEDEDELLEEEEDSRPPAKKKRT
uniref:F-box domain-containing protein n=1 Tax=Mycena chlorophos TaxID=658473 RepID=A0ABQ0M299_MYCCL|nr:predicted protein [Mycena chlorophos]